MSEAETKNKHNKQGISTSLHPFQNLKEIAHDHQDSRWGQEVHMEHLLLYAEYDFD